MEKELAGLVSQSTETNQAQVALFSLEAAAQSYRKIYDNFLQQHTESVQQQTFPITEARQTSAGVRKQNCPETLTDLDGDDICRRDARGRSWCLAGNQGPRVPDQGTSAICSCDRVPCAGSVANREPEKNVFWSAIRCCTACKDAAISDARGMALRSICSAPKVMRTVVDSPSSPYAEAIRSIKLTVDLNSKAVNTKVIGLTSCLPSEGKSSLAAAMAALIAQGGARVILVGL